MGESFTCTIYYPSVLLKTAPISSLKVDFRSNFPIRFLPLMNVVHKYEVDFIREAVCEQLSKDWPTSFATWEGKYVYDTLLEPAATIMFAERFAIPAVLPAVMYELSCASFNQNWKDRSFMKKSNPDGSWKTPGSSGWARWELLSTHQLLELGKLREAIDAMMSGVYKRIFSSDHRPGIRCNFRNSDPEILDTLRREAETMHLEEKNTHDVYAMLRSIPHSLQESTLCALCKERIHERCKREMHNLWNMLEMMCKCAFIDCPSDPSDKHLADNPSK